MTKQSNRDFEIKGKRAYAKVKNGRYRVSSPATWRLIHSCKASRIAISWHGDDDLDRARSDVQDGAVDDTALRQRLVVFRLIIVLNCATNNIPTSPLRRRLGRMRQ